MTSIRTRLPLEPIPAITLQGDDILIIHLGIGNMPPSKVKEYAESVKNSMQEMLGKERRMMVFPKKELDGIELQVLRQI